MRFRTTTSAYAAVIFSYASPALAGPPFVTDDPEPVEYQHWEIYTAMSLRRETGNTSYAIPSFEVNYGAAPDLQLHLIAPFAGFSSRDAGSDYGYGDTELGAKFRFVHETEDCPQIGTFPMLELPTGSSSRGLGTGHVQLFIPIWIQKSWDDEKWTTYGGGGFHLNPGTDNRDYFQFGWELQRKLTDGFTLGGELYDFTKSTTDGENSFGFNLGFIIDITENHHILFSAGRDFWGQNHFSTYLAYQLTF